MVCFDGADDEPRRCHYLDLKHTRQLVNQSDYPSKSPENPEDASMIKIKFRTKNDHESHGLVKLIAIFSMQATHHRRAE